MIKREEIAILLKLMTGKHLSDDQVSVILEQFVKEPLSYETFKQHFDSDLVRNKMSIKL